MFSPDKPQGEGDSTDEVPLLKKTCLWSSATGTFKCYGWEGRLCGEGFSCVLDCMGTGYQQLIARTEFFSVWTSQPFFLYNSFIVKILHDQ